MQKIPRIRPKYLRDRRGRRSHVVLTVAAYRELMECAQDAIDAKMIDEVRDEPTISWDEIKAKLDARR